jgi:HK97 family phage major capsid protein
MDKLKKQYSALVAQAKAISAGAEAEGRDMTADEAIQVNSIADKITDVRAELEALEAEQATIAQAAAAVADLDNDNFLASAAAAPRSRTQPVAATGRTVVVADAIDADPARGFSSPAAYLEAVREAFTAHANGQSVERIHAANPGLAFLAAAGSDEQSTFSDSYGGYLVPEAFSPQPRALTSEADPVAGLVSNVPMAAPTINLTARVDKNHTSSVSGGLRVYRRAEADTSSSSRQQYEKIRLSAEGLFGISYITEELLADSPVSFAALLAAGFRDEFGSKILDERLNGVGGGEFVGVNNSDALVTVTKESGQTADTIVYNNIIKMRARVWGYNRAIWLANHDCLPQLALMNQTVGTGGVPAWQPSAREDVPDMLLGRPLVFTEYMETVGDAGDINCCNWSQYLQGTYQPLQSDESIHVRFIQNERAFKFHMRNAGAPWWSAALTVKKGANSLSPFVRLAARA